MKKIIILGLILFYTSLSYAQTNRNSAEVFIQIKETGFFTVYLNNEIVGSETGRFRFYDVYNAKPLISIVQNNVVLYKNNLNITQNQRLVLDYSKSTGLTVVKQLNLYNNGQYALDDFDNSNTRNNQNYVIDTRTLSSEAFQQLYEMVRNEAFEDRRLNLILSSANKTLLTTNQIIDLLRLYAFDSKKLVAAKALYKKVIDPQNYFTVSNLFTFSSNKRDFLDFLNRQK